MIELLQLDAPPGNETWGIFYTVSSEYFHALGIEVLKGHGFTTQDTRNSPASGHY